MSGTLEITTKIGCKINCKYCPQSKLLKRYYEIPNKKFKPELMSFDTFKTCIDKVTTEVRIDFAGMCEPWLNPDCTKMLQYAAQKGHRITIFTTLVGMQEEDLDVIEKINIEQIVLHIPDKENHSKIIVNDEYKSLLKKAINMKLHANKGLSCHGTVHPEIEELLNEGWQLDNNIIDRAGNVEGDNIEHQRKKGKMICALNGSQINNNILLPDGNVVLCCMDYGLEHILGNLCYQDYSELFESSVAKEIKKGMEEDNSDILCRKCSNGLDFDKLSQDYFKHSKREKELYVAKEWFKEQLENYKVEFRKIEEFNTELIRAKDYFISQIESYQKEIESSTNTINKLEDAKDYFISQIESYQKEIESSKNTINKLEDAKDYYLSQIDAHQAEIKRQKIRSDELVEELKDYVDQVEMVKHKNMDLEDKISNLTSKNKFLSKELEVEKNKPWHKKIFR